MAGVQSRHHGIASRFRDDEHGGIKTLTGLLIIPTIVSMAFAIDYTRVTSVRAHMQQAADAAVLAARGGGSDPAATAKTQAEAFAKTNTRDMLGVSVKNIETSPTAEGFKIEMTATVPTPFASVIGHSSMDIKVSAESVFGSANMEVALVLDVTGSMAGSMADMKQGARDLTEALHGSTSSASKVKMAVVPYSGAVNIGNGATQMAWMDVNALSNHAGRGLSWHWAGYEPGCTFTPGGGGGNDPGTGTHGWLHDALPKFAAAFRWALGVSEAQAATAADVPPGYSFAPDCWMANPKVNFFTLFNQIQVPWRGCVMTRDPWNDRDVSDEAPNPADANSLFVPWFWPDTVDQAKIAANGYSWDSVNDYLQDRLDLRDAVAPKFNDPWIGWAHSNLFKYAAGNAPVIDESGPDTLGPNKACPDELLPLSDSKSAVLDRIDTLAHYNGSGTNTAEGVAWGMRVLTPGAPFTEGSSDPGVKKVMVVMTDGVNNLDPSTDNQRNSQWSSYSYLNDGRIQPATYEGFRQLVNGRMTKACEFAKAKGIEVYTVAFNVNDQNTEDLLRNCASKPPYAFSASTASELVEAFRAIGKNLSDLRLKQ